MYLGIGSNGTFFGRLRVEPSNQHIYDNYFNRRISDLNDIGE